MGNFIRVFFSATDWVVGYGHSIEKVLHYIDNPAKPDPKTLLDHIPYPTVIMEETSHSVDLKH